jgi:hypothetical protein
MVKEWRDRTPPSAWLRRQFSIAAATALAGCASASSGHGAGRSTMQADIERYLAFGWHRAGWPADRATADWLGERLTGLGYAVEFDAYEVETLTRADAALMVGSANVECALQWAPAEMRRDLNAVLARSDADAIDGAIAVLPSFAPAGAYWTAQADELVAQIARTGAAALVICTDTPAQAPFLYNRNARPALPIPVLAVSAQSHTMLLAAAAERASARVSLDVARGTVSTRNIMARSRGGAGKIVVSTPLTGWFGCGAERGPGVALLLALARALVGSNEQIVLLGSTSHELDHIGMERMLRTASPWAAETKLWIHLGSSIGVPRAATAPLLYATPNVRDVGAQEFGALGLVTEATATTPGETGAIIAAGFDRVAGFAGYNPEFHTARDEGQSIDHALLERTFRATQALINAAKSGRA